MTALEVAEAPLAEAPQHRRWPWIVASSIALALAGAVSWSRMQTDPLAGIELVSARHAELEDTVTALGKLQPRDYVDVGAQASGQVNRLAVRVGDLVEAGALLAEIDPRLQVAKLEIDRAQLAQLAAERRVQELQVELGKAQFERQTRMKEEGTTREDTFERAQSELRVASAKVGAIDAQIRQVLSTTKADEAQLGYTRIFAPMAGTVVSIDARPGQTLIASQQVPVLMRIADLSSMTVWAQVSEADITRLRTGMELYFTTLGHPDRKWRATLRQLLPAPPKQPPVSTPALNNVVLYTALFDVDNHAGELRPEMSAQVFFVVARAENAVVIPARALHENAVTVARDGRLEERTVKVGVRNRFDVQILEGLSANERVVAGQP